MDHAKERKLSVERSLEEGTRGIDIQSASVSTCAFIGANICFSRWENIPVFYPWKLVFEARRRGCRKKKKKSLFSFSHETSIVCPSCNENFPHDNFLLLLLLLLWILRSRHVFWEYLLFTDVLLERWKFLLQSSFGDFTLCLIFLLDWKWMVNDFLQFLFCR